MDQAPQPDATAEIAHEERRADVQRRMDEVASVLAETLLGMWRAKHRAERRGEAWPPPEPPKPEPRSSGLIEKPKGPPRRVFRELEARDELVANMLLEMTWFPTSELWLEPAGGRRTRAVLERGRVVIGAAGARGPRDLSAAEARSRARRVHRAARVRGRRRPHVRGQRDAMVRRGSRLRASQAHDVARGRASPPGHHRCAQQRLRLRAEADPERASRAATERAALGGRGPVDPVRTEGSAEAERSRTRRRAPPGRPRWPRARRGRQGGRRARRAAQARPWRSWASYRLRGPLQGRLRG